MRNLFQSFLVLTILTCAACGTSTAEPGHARVKAPPSDIKPDTDDDVVGPARPAAAAPATTTATESTKPKAKPVVVERPRVVRPPPPTRTGGSGGVSL